LQLALALYQCALLDEKAVQQTLEALYPARYDPWEELQIEVVDARGRGLISEAKLAELKHLFPQV